MYRLFPSTHRGNHFVTICIANLLLSFHYFLTLYIHSSFLSIFFPEKLVGIFYTAGSFINLVLLLLAPAIVKRIGTYALALISIVFEIFAIGVFAVSSSPALILIATLIHLAVVPLIVFSLDIFLEEESVGESKTGRIRSFFLTLSNATLVISPGIVALLTPRGGVTSESFRNVYLLSFLLLIPAFLVVFHGLKNIKKRIPTLSSMWVKTKEFFYNKNLRNIFASSLLLQIFYSWMIIYTPIYLRNNIGFDIPTIGVMFTIMLLPFVLFELPLGALADKQLGEKEILVFGFIITAVSTAIMSVIGIPSFLLWTTVLFLTRTGASFIEVMTETYFFKHVNGSDTDAIGIFRLTRPLSFIIGPLIATIALSFGPERFIFLTLSLIMLLGLIPAAHLKDTK
ncbi:MAG: MFS transporter [Patescibacteria group bacterium]